MQKSPVRYLDSFIAIETYIYMTSMMMLGITMEVSINKSLPIKGKTHANVIWVIKSFLMYCLLLLYGGKTYTTAYKNYVIKCISQNIYKGRNADSSFRG